MVRYFKDHDLLFLHIPRTGGSFVETAIRLCGLRVSRWTRNKTLPGVDNKHALIGQFYPHTIQNVLNYATFVRYIPDYYKSVWLWLSRNAKARRKCLLKRWHPFTAPAANWHYDFNVWAQNLVEAEPMWATRLFEAYVGPEGGEFCRFIGRTETIVEDFVRIFSSLGENTSNWKDQLYAIGKINEGARRKQAEWRPDVLEMVKQVEYPGIARWERNKDKRWYGSEQFDTKASKGIKD